MKTVETMTAEIFALDSLLTKISSGTAENNEAERIVSDILSHCREVRKDSGMFFYVVEDPHDMPADARVDFLYRPTYLAAAILICIAVQMPVCVTGDKAARFAGVLLACTGRDFRGHGYEAEEGLVDSLDIFLRAPLKRFLELHSAEHSLFARTMHQALEDLRGICGGTIQPVFGKDDDLVRRAKDLFARWENS